MEELVKFAVVGFIYGGAFALLVMVYNAVGKLCMPKKKDDNR